MTRLLSTNIAVSTLLTATMLWRALLLLALIGMASSTVFLAMVLVAALRYRRYAKQAQLATELIAESSLPAVTVLKPVHGPEPRLAENLESFFRQDYPNFEVMIGARDAENAALQVAEQVRRRFPQVKSSVVLSGPPTWPSAKVFSLDKMIKTSANSYFVISDSDILVKPDFLRNIIPPLLGDKTAVETGLAPSKMRPAASRRSVGLVTCLYQGIPAGDFWSLLEALGMSVEMPSGVMVADMMEGMRFALGAAMAVRRDALNAIGGIAATADYYSDDFVLGNEIWARGYRVLLSHYVVGHVLVPRSLSQTFGDQLRWMKSTRYSRPKGHVGAGLTYAMPFGLLGLVSAAAAGYPRLGIALLAAAYVNRVIQALSVGWGIMRDSRAMKFCWLYPLRDLLGFFTWAGSFGRRRFFWRGENYRFDDDGKIIPQHRPANGAVAEQP